MAATLTKEEKQWFVVALLIGIGIIVAFFYLYYRPASQTYDKLVIEKDTLKKEVDEYRAIVEGPEYTQRVEDLKLKIAAFEQKLPSEKEVPELLTFLRNAADQSDVQYITIKSEKLIPADFYIEVPFTVVLEGKYHNIGTVVNKIENHERLLKVDNINATTEEKPPYNHKILFKMSTYVFNPNPPAPKEEKKK